MANRNTGAEKARIAAEARAARIAREVRAANEWFFGGGRERFERAVEAERRKPSTNYYSGGVSPLGGLAKPWGAK